MTAPTVRDYAPAAVIHEADCKGAPPGLIAFRAGSLMETHPNGRPHICFDLDTVRNNRLVVAEPVDYEPHLWEPSTIRPDDARRALCRICRGTHGDGRA